MAKALEWTFEQMQDITTSYERGESIGSIGKRYGTSYRVIQPLLAKQGVKLRSLREANKKRSCDCSKGPG